MNCFQKISDIKACVNFMPGSHRRVGLIDKERCKLFFADVAINTPSTLATTPVFYMKSLHQCRIKAFWYPCIHTWQHSRISRCVFVFCHFCWETLHGIQSFSWIIIVHGCIPFTCLSDFTLVATARTKRYTHYPHTCNFNSSPQPGNPQPDSRVQPLSVQADGPANFSYCFSATVTVQVWTRGKDGADPAHNKAAQVLSDRWLMGLRCPDWILKLL